MSDFVSVRIVNLDTNEEKVLYEREDSECRFLEPFSYKNYEIQLRFHLEEIINGEPTLDADIKDKTTGKCLSKREGARDGWHHTQANEKIYDFRFDDLRLRLSIIRTMRVSFSGSLTVKEQKT